MRALEARVGSLGISRLLIRRRYAVEAVCDALAWLVAIVFATLVRHDFSAGDVAFEGILLLAPVVVAAQVLAGLACGLYVGRWRFGSFDEVAALARAAAIATAIVLGVDLAIRPDRPVPVSAVVAGGIVALVLMGASRYAWRLLLESRRRPSGDELTRLVVFGAGEGAQQVITAMLRDRDSPYLPVALLDDDQAKRNLRLSGVRVQGNRHDLAEVVERTSAHAVLIAIPSASAALVAEITDLASAVGLPAKVVPPVAELFGDGVGLGDIRDVTEADLLGRHEVQTDLASIAGYITGRRVLVTGAGGSIGSELCRQLWHYAPSELMMLDRDESALHAVQLSIEGRALLDSDNLILANVRDRELMRRIFEERRPDVVFHAAALKHLSLLERHPAEALKSNVLGTLNVLDAAMHSGVDRFVNISTDKAADPVSVLGCSKRIAERLTADADRQASGDYLSVRFGNVLGSRGSVLVTFQAQVQAGGPITVTHPDVTRFFMTVQEAVELLIQAAAIGKGGDALVLDMGQPVRIDDVARRLAERAERPVKIVYTGLRPGEKLHEVLFGEGEVDRRPVHPLVSHVTVPPLELAKVRDADAYAPGDEVVALMERLCRTSEQTPREAFGR